MKTQILGKLGENQAQNFLISQNYKIIKTNYRSRFGEVDIIAIDRNSKELAFIEVKTRSTCAFGTPVSALTPRKHQKIIKTALKFLNSTTQKLPKHWRIDIIGIQLDRKKSSNLIHIKNI